LADDIKVRFGRRLREIRKRASISQEKLGAQAGIARNFVSMIENGQRNVTLATIQKLAAALGCTMSTLMPDADDE